MQECDQQEKHSAPVMYVAHKLPEHYLVFQEDNRIIGPGRGRHVIKPEQNTGNDLVGDQQGCHPSQPESTMKDQ